MVPNRAVPNPERSTANMKESSLTWCFSRCQRASYWSGRQDSNLRPLDPQEHATLLFSLRSAMRPGRKRCCWCRTVVCVVVTAVVSSPLVPSAGPPSSPSNFDEVPRRCRRSFRRSWTLGPCGVPSTWRSPTTRQPGGSPRRGPAPASYRSALGLPCGSPQGRSMGCHTLLADLSQQCSDRPSWRPAGVRGGERPRLVPSNLVSGLARGTSPASERLSGPATGQCRSWPSSSSNEAAPRTAEAGGWVGG
jgi:hypothetical protein